MNGNYNFKMFCFSDNESQWKLSHRPLRHNLRAYECTCSDNFTCMCNVTGMLTENGKWKSGIQGILQTRHLYDMYVGQLCCHFTLKTSWARNIRDNVIVKELSFSELESDQNKTMALNRSANLRAFAFSGHVIETSWTQIH